MRGSLTICPLLLLLLAGPAAGAEDGAGGVDCRTQIERLCPDSEPRSAERRACMREKSAELSPSCQEKLARGRNRLTAGIEALRRSCGPEIDQHCDEVRRRNGRLVRCLRGLDAAQASERCRGYLRVLDGMRAQREASN